MTGRALRRVAALLVAVPLPAAGLIGLAATSNPAGAASTEEDACYVTVAFGAFLGRNPTPAEVASWVGRFGAGTPLWALPAELADSDEWLGRMVSGLYQQALGRDPEAAGRAYWIGRLRAGALVNEVATQIYGSTEFYANAGGTDPGFVGDLYTRILHRTPDPGGSAYWVGRVKSRSRGYVASSFFASIESRTGRVDAIYLQLLGRNPDPGGRAYWADRLLTMNDVRLAVNLASSTEFYAGAQDYCAH